MRSRLTHYLTKESLKLVNNMCLLEGREKCLSAEAIDALPDDLTRYYPIFPETFERQGEGKHGVVEVVACVTLDRRAILDRRAKGNVLISMSLAVFNALPEMIIEPGE